MNDVNELRTLLDQPDGAQAAWFQERGRKFERVLNQMLEEAGMDPRGSMRPSGEEIDGSFASSGQYFLFEAKWRKTPIPASDLYAFKGKVDGKLVGTVGVVFSMSGYGADAVDALIAGKELNLILFDSEDLLLVEEGKISLRDALSAKLRYASERGQPFFSLNIWMTERREHQKKKLNRIWQVVVESEIDAEAFRILLGRLGLQFKATVIAAGGQLAIVPLISHLKEFGFKNVAAMISHDATEQFLEDLRRVLSDSAQSLVMFPSTPINWMESACDVNDLNAIEMLTQRPGKMERRYARLANLDRLLLKSPKFAAFIEMLKRGDQ
jgi:hypothetical protein